jgi:YidC/Oxa1 family membrane protein insertase
MWDAFQNFMINLLLVIYKFIGPDLGLPFAFGLAIIIFTILIRLATLPLTIQQQRSTKKMQELQQDKRFQKLQEKYKDDSRKLQEEQMKLYQEAGVNPFSGCLPTLIQLPIIFGLYGAIIRALGDSPIQLLDFANRITWVSSSILPLDSDFLWMNLGQPERWAPAFLANAPVFQDIFAFLGGGLPVLAIIVVITSFFSTKLTTPPSTTGGQGQMTSQIMSLYLPLFMGYFAYTLASGLALYFVVSNFLQIVQSALINRGTLSSLFQRKTPAEETKRSKT